MTNNVDPPEDPFPPTSKREHTDPAISLTRLKHQAARATKGNRINLGLIIAALGLVGGAYFTTLKDARAQAQEKIGTELTPVKKDVEVLRTWAVKHEATQEEMHKEDVRYREHQNDKLDAILMRFNIPQPPLRSEADGGPDAGK